MSNDEYQHRNTFCNKMKKESIKFPEIEGLKWPSKGVVDIIELPIELYNRSDDDLGITSKETIESVMYFDLSKITAVRYYFPKNESGTYSPDECVIEADGLENGTVVVPLSLPKIMKAWLFYKKYKNDSRDIRHTEQGSGDKQ